MDGHLGLSQWVPERQRTDVVPQLQGVLIQRLIPGAFFDLLVNQVALLVDNRRNDDFPLPSV